MQKLISPLLKNKFFLISTLLAMIGYFLVLTLRVPVSLLAYWRNYSILSFFLVLLFYYLAFQIPGRGGWLVGFGITLLFFALALLYLWTSGFTNNGIIGGLLPYKDGRFYYWSSQMLLNGERISIMGNQGYERPLFPGFLSFLLLVTQSNLKWSLAILVAIAACAAYLATRRVFEEWGSLPAAVFGALLYTYIQSLLGFNNSELPGYIFGCLGFALLWRSGVDLNITEIALGILATMLAVSARAGAFFIFPALILWAGWVFRKDQRFSFKIAAVVTTIVILAFLTFNVIYPKLVVEPGGVTFGNFAYMLYGQVRGGTGWTEGFRVTGTKDPAVIMQAALDFFRRHPFSLVIGSLKAYRDFFLPISNSIFPYRMGLSVKGIVHFILWLVSIGLLLTGLVKAYRQKSQPLNSMVFATFGGIFLSIPFLPPIDGGSRFYAGTMAFFYAPIALGLKTILRQEKTRDFTTDQTSTPLRFLSIGLITLTILTPISLRILRGPEEIKIPECADHQEPFALRVNPGSYIDLLPDDSQPCNLIPNVCLSDFLTNSEDKSTDDFYQELVNQALTTTGATRIVPSHNFADGNFHYFLGPVEKLPLNTPDHLVAGCAIEIRTEHQSIYKVESILNP